MTTTENKQQALVESIANAVQKALKADLDQITKSLALLNTTASALDTRLSMLETAASAGGAKRPTKTTGKSGAASTGAKKSAGGSKKGGKDDLAKVINSMLFFRYEWVNDEEFRTSWSEALAGGQDIQETFANEQSITKKEKGTPERLSAEAQYLWKSILSDEQKKSIREAFNKWQEERKLQGEEPQLEEDGNNS